MFEFGIEAVLIFSVYLAVKIILQVRICGPFLKKAMFSFTIVFLDFSRDNSEYVLYKVGNSIWLKDIYKFLLISLHVDSLSEMSCNLEYWIIGGGRVEIIGRLEFFLYIINWGNGEGGRRRVKQYILILVNPFFVKECCLLPCFYYIG